jgi:hypothetical protein
LLGLTDNPKKKELIMINRWFLLSAVFFIGLLAACIVGDLQRELSCLICLLISLAVYDLLKKK